MLKLLNACLLNVPLTKGTIIFNILKNSTLEYIFFGIFFKYLFFYYWIVVFSNQILLNVFGDFFKSDD